MGEFDGLSRAEAFALLDELYDQLPDIECKGMCQDSCVQIHVPLLERQRVRDVTGIELAPPVRDEDHRRLIREGRTPRCSALGPLGTCRAYEVRPFVCRAFGMVMYNDGGKYVASAQSMMCDYGCVPDGIISTAEFYRVLLRIEALSEAIVGTAS